MARDERSGGPRPLQKPPVEQCRMHAAVRVKQHAALIAIRCNFAADIRLAQHVDRHAEITLQRLRIARHRRVIGLRPGAAQPPAHLQLGVDLLVEDQRFRKFE